MAEAWLEGPVVGVPPVLMPVAHSLLDAVREIERVRDLDVDRLWARPAGMASVGFHLEHVVGSLDRLLTYARGEQLTPAQLASLGSEGEPGEEPSTADELVGQVGVAVQQAIDYLRSLADLPHEALLARRVVGRRALPSTVLGLLFHAAEHTRRHAGQLIVTERLVRANPERPALPLGVVRAALAAWEDAGIRGLCDDGRLAAAVDTLRDRGVDTAPDSASLGADG